MAINYNQIIKKIASASKRFERSLSPAQRSMYESVLEELNRLELSPNGTVKATVKNLGILDSMRGKMNKILATEKYSNDVKNVLKAFSEITKLQNEYWKSIESKFKPRPLLKAIRRRAITDTRDALLGAGIWANVSDRVVDIIKTSITSGGSYARLIEQIRDGLLDTSQAGYLKRYAGQVVTDSLNQYSAQYSKIVSSDLGYEWFVYSGSDITTTRCFCDAMTDKYYFHISEIPSLLKGEGLMCTDKTTGEKIKVKIYKKTGLPYGMIPGTDVSNFQVYRGGYRCGHQVLPTEEALIPDSVKQEVYNKPAYKKWKALKDSIK